MQVIQSPLYTLSVPISNFEQFRATLYHDFLDNAPRKLSIGHLTNFAYQLRTHQNLFFGENDETGKNRKLFVNGALELSILDNFFGNEFGIAIGNYALLIGDADDSKLDLYRQKVLRARELNGNFVCPVSNGLVAILKNLSLPNAQLFTSEAFELLNYDEGCCSGLSEASAYITLRSNSALKRFEELLNQDK